MRPREAAKRPPGHCGHRGRARPLAAYVADHDRPLIVVRRRTRRRSHRRRGRRRRRARTGSRPRTTECAGSRSAAGSAEASGRCDRSCGRALPCAPGERGPGASAPGECQGPRSPATSSRRHSRPLRASSDPRDQTAASDGCEREHLHPPVLGPSARALGRGRRPVRASSRASSHAASTQAGRPAASSPASPAVTRANSSSGATASALASSSATQ